MPHISLPEGIELDDPRPIAASAPYTYFMPHPDEIAALKSGDGVQATFRQLEGAHTYDAERMWVRIDRIENGFVFGTLENEPHGMDKFKLGDPVSIPLTHVISTTFAEGNARPTVPELREYWDRCLVDACVLDGRSHVDYFYREDPDLGSDDDKYPDSGWRIRGTEAAIEEDKRLGKQAVYIALGKVLNEDDRWIHLIESEIGACFQWDAHKSDFVELS